MPLGLAIKLDSDVHEAHPLSVSGHGVAQAIEVLDKVAKQYNVTPLSSFMSYAQEEVPDAAEGQDLQNLDTFVINESWFDPGRAMFTVRALCDWVTANPNLVPHPEAVIEDLNNLDKVLKDAEHIGVRFHFALQNPTT